MDQGTGSRLVQTDIRERARVKTMLAVTVSTVVVAIDTVVLREGLGAG